jgi:hypothetical protein
VGTPYIAAAERARLADAIEMRTFAAGEAVVTQGEEGEAFYIVEEGQAAARIRFEATVMDVTAGVTGMDLANCGEGDDTAPTMPQLQSGGEPLTLELLNLYPLPFTLYPRLQPVNPEP